MAENKKMVEAITSRDEDFAKWYTDIVKKAELVDYSGVKGCMVIRPYGYALWELMQADMDRRFKETGHENVYMPMFIPESLLQSDPSELMRVRPSGMLYPSVVYECDFERGAVGKAHEL